MIHIAGIKLKTIKQIDNAHHDLHAKNQVNWVMLKVRFYAYNNMK